jgi:hypothetical protein
MTRKVPRLSATARALQQVMTVRLFITFILLISLLISFSLPAAQAAGKYFLVEQLTGLKFRIVPQIPGPVSTSLTGGSPRLQLITRQEQGRTVILARLSPGSTLLVRVGPHRLRLWVSNPPNSNYHEDQD